MGYKCSRGEYADINHSHISRCDPVDTIALAMLTFAISGILWNALLGPVAFRPVIVVVTTLLATAFFVVDQSRLPTNVRLGPDL